MSKKSFLITGASSGIGEAVAYRLAKMGHELILLGRNAEKLAKITKACEQYGAVKVRQVILDLSTGDAASKLFLQAQQESWADKVDVLINNAGIGYRHLFQSQPVEVIQTMLAVNVTALVGLTRLFLPGIILRKGQVVNLGSVYSFAPISSQALYGATKAFVLSFSLALKEELKDTGVNVLCVCPGSTRTSFHQHAGVAVSDKASVFFASADKVAKQITRSIGTSKSVLITGWYNKLFVNFVRVLPIRFVTAIVRFIAYRVRGVEEGK